jgi:hypothetical protein
MSHDPISKRTHVSIIKTHNDANFILFGDKFLLTSPSLYKYINNINKINQMTANIGYIYYN